MTASSYRLRRSVVNAAIKRAPFKAKEQPSIPTAKNTKDTKMKMKMKKFTK